MKLYHTSDVKELLEEKEKDAAMALVNTENATNEGIVAAVRRLRLFKEFGDELIDAMEALDAAYDEELRSWREAHPDGKST